MAKGYLIAHINIHDKEGFEKFREMSLPIIAKYEGKALIRNPYPDLREGENAGLVIALEFESIEHAKRFYESDEYSAAKIVREMACSTELVLVEGI
tara:strand:- start:390 stop:677 length:288 start_codon:yes stop_codon:yes gene_type:complete